jgi:protein O-GlcNAc transferase
MRGRHSYAILNYLGITETIAKSVEDYINIAINLGTNSDFRQYIIQKISEFKFKIYEDKTCVEALENFYEESIISHSLLSK